jgi:protein gp37
MTDLYWNAQWSVVQGCTPASEGCQSCWARKMHERFHKEPFGDVRVMPERLAVPLHWRKPRVVFVANTADLFHERVPFEFVAAVYGVMAACPQHTFLMCTKRPERRAEWYAWHASESIAHHYPGGFLHQAEAAERGTIVMDPMTDVPLPLPNVWEGVTVENQACADERIPILLATPAAHRWVSAEPMLGPIDFAQCLASVRAAGLVMRDQQRIDQVIVGGESGSRARPCDVDWIRSIVRQCEDADTPCFVKQLGSRIVDGCAYGLADCVIPPLRSRAGSDPSEWPEALRVRNLVWR